MVEASEGVCSGVEIVVVGDNMPEKLFERNLWKNDAPFRFFVIALNHWCIDKLCYVRIWKVDEQSKFIDLDHEAQSNPSIYYRICL
jgi:hypothetical protein